MLVTREKQGLTLVVFSLAEAFSWQLWASAAASPRDRAWPDDREQGPDGRERAPDGRGPVPDGRGPVQREGGPRRDQPQRCQQQAS